MYSTEMSQYLTTKNECCHVYLYLRQSLAPKKHGVKSNANQYDWLKQNYDEIAIKEVMSILRKNDSKM